MQQVTEFPRSNSIVQQRLTDRHGPEGVRSLSMERADDRSPSMFHFQGSFYWTQGFANADCLQGRKETFDNFSIEKKKCRETLELTN